MSGGAAPVRTAVVLQGGGALGAYEYGVLRALHEQRPGFAPVAVAGVSIGAITAAVLGGARGDPIAALGTLWRDRLTVDVPGFGPVVDRSVALWGNPGLYGLRPEALAAPWLVDSVYDSSPLRATLAALVDPRRLNGAAPRVVVGATDVATGEMAFFDRDTPGGLRYGHVVASASLPPGLPATVVDGRVRRRRPAGHRQPPVAGVAVRGDRDAGAAGELSLTLTVITSIIG